MAITMNQASVGTAASLLGSIPPAGYFMAAGSAGTFLGTGSAVTTGTGFQVTSAAPVVWQNSVSGAAVPVYAVASSTAATLSFSFGNGPAGQVIAGSGGSAALQLNHSAALIQPVGVAGTAGSTGLAADAGHVHSGMALLATTGAAGTALINGTSTLLTWTAPNDGNLHRLEILGAEVMTSTGTGGQVTIAFADPNNGSQSFTLFTANAGGGYHTPQQTELLVHAGSAVTIAQSSALTGGVGTLFIELWGS